MNGKIFNKVNYVIHKIRLIKNGDEKHLNDKKQSKAYLWLANTKRKVLLLMSDENLWDKINIFALFSTKTSKTHKYLGNYPEYNYEYYLWTRGGDIFLKAVFFLALHWFGYDKVDRKILTFTRNHMTLWRQDPYHTPLCYCLYQLAWWFTKDIVSPIHLVLFFPLRSKPDTPIHIIFYISIQVIGFLPSCAVELPPFFFLAVLFFPKS